MLAMYDAELLALECSTANAPNLMVAPIALGAGVNYMPFKAED